MPSEPQHCRHENGHYIGDSNLFRCANKVCEKVVYRKKEFTAKKPKLEGNK